MGDLGWFDGEGRLWFCGRKSQRVVVDASPRCAPSRSSRCSTPIRRCCAARWSASAKQVRRQPVLVYELKPGVTADVAEVNDELRHIGEGFVHTGKVKVFLRHPKPFPVDIRHNAKIGREKLAAWASKQAIKDSQ
jgi:hypothetical protein